MRSTASPKRSSSCGRSSPSSGFIEPTSTKRAACSWRDPFALDPVDAGGGDVEQHVDEVVGEQVDLVDVEHAAVGRGQQAGLEARPSPRSSDGGRGRASRRRGPRWRRAAARRTARRRAAGRRGRAPGSSWPTPSRPAAAPRRCAGRSAARSSASLASSCPTTALNGKRLAGFVAFIADSSHALGLEQRGTQRVDGRRRWRPTCPARRASSSRSAIDAQRPRVRPLEELPHLGVGDVGLGHPLVHPVLDDVRRWRRSRRGSRRWPPSRTRPCSRGAAWRRSTSG